MASRATLLAFASLHETSVTAVGHRETNRVMARGWQYPGSEGDGTRSIEMMLSDLARSFDSAATETRFLDCCEAAGKRTYLSSYLSS